MTQLEVGHDLDPDWDTDTDSCVAELSMVLSVFLLNSFTVHWIVLMTCFHVDVG